MFTFSLSLYLSRAYCANLSFPLNLRFLLFGFLYCFHTPFFSPRNHVLKPSSILEVVFSIIKSSGLSLADISSQDGMVACYTPSPMVPMDHTSAFVSTTLIVLPPHSSFSSTLDPLWAPPSVSNYGFKISCASYQGFHVVHHQTLLHQALLLRW